METKLRYRGLKQMIETHLKNNKYLIKIILNEELYGITDLKTV